MKKPRRLFSRRNTCATGYANDQRRPHRPAARHRSLLLAHLDAWREAADDVEAASRRWRAASGPAREQAAHAFFASLDREEYAAAAYQVAWEA